MYMFTVMESLLQQLKKRRIDLNLRQKDMMLRIGVSRQQYQHLESKGNPRLGTLELIAKGLNSELILIPKEKLSEVRAVLERENFEPGNKPTKGSQDKENKSLSDNPWQDLIEDDLRAQTALMKSMCSNLLCMADWWAIWPDSIMVVMC